MRFGRLSVLTGALGAGLVSVIAAVATVAAPAQSATVAHLTTAAAASPSSGVRVPWSKVGPGWELVEYTASTRARPAAVSLYLIGPDGTRYTLETWRSSAPALLDWSGDKTRALLTTGGSSLEQLTLATGRVTAFRLPGNAQPIGYTRPSGLNVVGVTIQGSRATLARYSLSGKLVKVLASGAGYDNAVYSANGTVLAVSGDRGLELVSNTGGLIRPLPVPATDSSLGCSVSRWWNNSTVLAACLAEGTSVARLWLVPADGARPAPLTPQRGAKGPDYGDIGAWRLPSGLYLQSAGACGSLQINRQAPNGSTTAVNVPGTEGNNKIITALGSRLLVSPIYGVTGCSTGQSLLWFNPGTHAEQWLLRAPAGTLGVIGAVPYHG